MVIFPNAKINLGLNVLSRRSDGYHDIETVMMPVPAFDIIEITESTRGEDQLHTCGRHVDCPPENNLVMKALAKMKSSFAIPPVSICLNKQIPDGAGLGGGSADASFTLRLLNEMFGCGASQEQLAEMAAELGADCPFFVYNRPMLCTGTGTTMAPFELRLPENLWILLIKPPVSVPTKEAYSGLTPKTPEYSLIDTLQLPMEQWQGKLTNDFEPSVFARYPVVGAIKERLLRAGAIYASMSGSGSALFGFFDHELSPDEIKQLSLDSCYLFSKIK